MKSVQHIGLNCKDRAATQAFYERFFGFRCVRRFLKDSPQEFVMMRLNDTCLELFVSGDPSQTGGEQPVGFKHLAFEVEDLDAKVRELHDAGIETDDIIDCSEMVPGLRVCFFKDPDGNVLELMENWTDDPAESA